MVDLESAGHPQRENTDESLRAERDKADAGIEEKRTAAELGEDEVVRLARQRADQVVQTARDDADRVQAVSSPTDEAHTEQQRTRADDLLGRERSEEDALVENERAKRRRYMADFLAVEREATDEDLTGEREQADTAIASRDDFLATVSHDLRNLLNGLSLNSQALVELAPEGPAGDSMRKRGAVSGRLVARMNRLIGDLLDISSLDAGKLAIVPEPIEVSKLLRETLEAFEPIATLKRIALDAEEVALPGHAWLDGGRILQVLANLVANAIKFTPAGGRVSVRIRAERGELHFSVSDTGMGIPEGALQAVFARFCQLHADRRGLGLGLHISKRIIEAHGGRMWVESMVGRGSTFHFSLPT